MNLIKFDPYTRTSSMNNLFDSFFNNAIGDFVGSDNVRSHPAVNIAETEEAFTLEVAAPGLAKDDFDISVEKNSLAISAERKTDAPEVEGKYSRREFSYATFRRTFRLPRSVEQDAISAAYKDGVLKLTLPKKTEVVKRAQARAITVS
jgi:HSP20 family protein